MNEPNRTQWQIRCAFNGFCKRTLKNEAINAHGEIKRRQLQEVSFSDLTPQEENQLYTYDTYFEHDEAEKSFCVAGKEITAKLLAEALHSLPDDKREAVLLYYFFEMNDAEIAKLRDVPRSTIQYRRTSSFELLKRYLEERGLTVNKAEEQRLANGCTGVKKSTGQHPGGIVVIPKEYDVYDFTPVQHPADDPKSDIVTTHFAFKFLHDTILKLDLLGHDVPTKYKMMEKFSGLNVLDLPMNDPEVMELFISTKSIGVEPEDIDSEVATFGLPEFGTKFVRQMIVESKPKNFTDLLQISGLSHGTDVWLGNAQELIHNGICTISEVIGTRDSIMTYLIHKGLDPSLSFNIMEITRKGKAKSKLTPEMVEEMKRHDVPDWYIDSCFKIKYMFPKAHAVAYDMSALRLGWFKVHMPQVFYAAFLSVAPGGFDADIVTKGKDNIKAVLREIEAKGKDASQKETDMIATLQLCNEACARGFVFLRPDIKKSHSFHFLPEGEKGIRCPFSSMGGLGEAAAESLYNACQGAEILSVEDLRTRAQVSKAVIEILRKNGVLDNLSETNQLTMF